MAGQPLPSAVLQQIKGDWDYFSGVLGLNHWKSHLPCFFCATMQDDINDPASAPLLSNQDFFDRAKAMNQPLPEFLSLPSVDFTKAMCPDWMHTVDLGVGQDVVGGIFFDCVAQPGIFPGATQDLRMQGLWHCIQSFYKKNPPQSQIDGPAESWTVKKKLRSSGADVPALRAKAAQCRGIQPLAATLAAYLHEVRNTQHTKLVLELAQAFEDLRTHASIEFNHGGAKAALAKFLECYRQLDKEGQANNLWRMKPKCHLLHHLIEQTCQHHGQVQHFWNYGEESLGGRYAKMAITRGGVFNRGLVAKDLFLSTYKLQEFYP